MSELRELEARQRFGLWLEGHTGLHTPPEAAQFIDEVAVALRYFATGDLPLASMYRATQARCRNPKMKRLPTPVPSS